MGHYCRICGQIRSNESFSGRGHRDHICKHCSKLPKERRQNIEAQDELFSMFQQSHISEKNIKRLRTLKNSTDSEIAELASIVLDVTEICPYKKRRLKMLAHKRRDLITRMESVGLIDFFIEDFNQYNILISLSIIISQMSFFVV